MLGWIVLIAIVLLAYYAILRGGEAKSPAFEEPEAVEIQDFTPHTLKQYNGVDHGRVLIAIRGKVFDVTNGKAHYGPGGPYANFAGRDASRGLAKHSFEDDMLTPLDAPIDTLSDLNNAERDSLAQWAEFFEGKYPYCGRLINP